nr:MULTISPECIES: MMPL family transporter [Halostella]
MSVPDGLADRYARFLAARYRLVAVAVLVLTCAVAAGAVVGESEDGGIGQFETESAEQAALDEIERDYPADDAVVAQVVVRDGNVLSRESLLESLRLQRSMRANDSVNATLRDDRAPVAVVVVALLLASAGAYGATGIETEFNRADFLPEDAPDWAKSLPGPLAAGDFAVRENAAFLGDNFRQRGGNGEAQVLLRGNVTDPATLRALDAATRDPDRGGTVVVRGDGTAAIDGPHTLVREVAAENETVAAAVDARDADGDGLPDEDVAAVYDLTYDAAPDRAAAVLARTGDGEYASARLTVGVRADASAQTVAGDVRAVADRVEADAPVTAVATGGPVITAVLQDALLETLVQAFAVTLVVIGVLLTALYARRHGAPELGVVTLAPVVVALAWLLGTMSVVGIPFNSETAVITSLAIGLGVDYSIHLGERFVDERERSDDLRTALTAATTGTGGALLGSAATTAAGFGVLTLALAPPLRRFGTVTGISIVYAFVACVTVLPCLFVLRERVSERLA